MSVFFVHAVKVISNKTALLATVFKIPSFMFHKRKSVIQVWNDMRVNDDRFFIFLVNYPINVFYYLIISLLNKMIL